MGTFEILLTGAVFLALAVSCFAPGRTFLVAAMTLSSICILIIHALYETPRLGMVGVYCILVFVITSLMVPTLTPSRWGIVLATFFVPLALWPVASVTVIPPLMVPAPSGPFLVGRVTPHLAMKDWLDFEYRAPAVQLWYPVDRSSTLLPKFYERHFRKNGLFNARIAKDGQDKFPLVLFFSGGAGLGIEANFVRELVSHGYVVATIYYPLDLQGLSAEALARRRTVLNREIFDFSSEAAFQDTIRTLDARVHERAKDASLVLDQIVSLSTEEAVENVRSRLAIDRIGIQGISFGGAVAAEARKFDRRFQAAVNMDGSHFGSALDGVPGPYLFMISQDTIESHIRAVQQNNNPSDFGDKLTVRDYSIIEKMKTFGGDVLELPGATHLNFFDYAFGGSLVAPTPGLGIVNKYRMFRVISNFMVTFFNVHLRDYGSEALRLLANEYPEVPFTSWSPETSSRGREISPEQQQPLASR